MSFQMTGETFDSLNTFQSPWAYRAIFGVVCALIIGLLVFGAKPDLFEFHYQDAGDCYYNLLVQGFRAGQLNLKKDPPPGLAQLADPYDPAANGAYPQVGDLSYYHGKLYLYFGAAPAVVLFWPFVAFSGHYLQDAVAGLIFCSAGFLCGAGLCWAIWQRYFAGTSVWVAMALITTWGLVVVAQEVEWLYCRVYEVALSCGFAFAMLALVGIWLALHRPARGILWLSFASLAYGLAIGSRPSLLFGAIILLIPVFQAWRATGKGAGRYAAWLFLAATGPIALIGAGLMVYNQLRFGSPFEFGYRYQLTGLDQNNVSPFSLHYLWFNFRYYFLEPASWNSHFPFLQIAPQWASSSGHFGPGTYFGGIIFVNFPLAWLAFCAPLAWRGRSNDGVFRWFVGAVFLLFAACVLPLLAFLYANNRYELDFLPALALLAVIGIFGLDRALAGKPFWRVIARVIWCSFMLYFLTVNLFAGFDSRASIDNLIGNEMINRGLADESIGVFRQALALEPQYGEAHDGLANALNITGKTQEAIVEYQKALEIKPGIVEAHFNLGACLLRTGRVDDAIVQYQEAIEINPRSVTYHNALGNAFLQERRMDEAISQYQEELEINPNLVTVHAVLGDCFMEKGRVDDAIAEYQKAIQLQPNFYQAYNALGNAYHLKKMAAEAVASYQKAVEIQPEFIPAQVNLAWIWATWPEAGIRNGNQAVTVAERACQRTGGNVPRILRTLAAAYAETGRFSEAISTDKQALALAQAQSDKVLVNKLQAEIHLYQTGSPYRSTGD
jgi:tetratricopeptide (TPR) repeat protein